MVGNFGAAGARAELLNCYGQAAPIALDGSRGLNKFDTFQHKLHFAILALRGWMGTSSQPARANRCTAARNPSGTDRLRRGIGCQTCRSRRFRSPGCQADGFRLLTRYRCLGDDDQTSKRDTSPEPSLSPEELARLPQAPPTRQSESTLVSNDPLKFAPLLGISSNAGRLKSIQSHSHSRIARVGV
jgi:hypothetical protein